MTDQEYACRDRAAREETQRTLAPYIDWLAKTDIIFAKVTIVQNLDGAVTITKEYPPEVQHGIDEMTELMKTVQAAIWAYHFPGKLTPTIQ